MISSDEDPYADEGFDAGYPDSWDLPDMTDPELVAAATEQLTLANPSVAKKAAAKKLAAMVDDDVCQLPDGERSERMKKSKSKSALVSGLKTGADLLSSNTTPLGAYREGATVRDSDRPVVLVSAGVGVTPLLAMLHALHDRRSTRYVWWFHGARNRSEHAFADEARSLVDGLAHAHRRIWYSRPDPTDRADTDYDAVGRITPEALEAAGVPIDGVYYLCGPNAFMDALREGLVALGVPAELVHTEIFGAQDAITPGVVAASGAAAASTRG